MLHLHSCGAIIPQRFNHSFGGDIAKMRNIKTNNKAVTGVQIGVILLIIAVVVAIVVAVSGSAPPTETPKTGLLITFDGVQQTWNNTTPQQLNWGSVAPSMSYTKNVSVTNLEPQTLTLILKTSEPQGSHQSWPKNNTALAPNATTFADLTLSTSSPMESGSYTWLLQGSNGTITPTTSPTPTGTPAPQSFNCTVKAQNGIASVNVTNLNQPGSGYTIIQGNFPKTFIALEGTLLKLEVTLVAGYTFNGWTFNDGTFPQSTNSIIVLVSKSFEVTAESLLTTP
jgi:hypothetical protein